MDKLLPILAIETSGEMCSASVFVDENSFVEINFYEKHIHSKKIVDMIDCVLSNSKYELKDMKAIAVSGGPGSFTGLRIGFSVAKGLAFGAGLPIIPVPTYDACAMQISKSLNEGSEFIIANKASIEDVYFSKYKIDNKKCSPVIGVKQLHKDELKAFCSDTEFLFGNSFDKQINITASSVAAWAYLFGRDLLNFDYDYLEPEYFGNPFLKKTKVEK